MGINDLSKLGNTSGLGALATIAPEKPEQELASDGNQVDAPTQEKNFGQVAARDPMRYRTDGTRRGLF